MELERDVGFRALGCRGRRMQPSRFLSAGKRFSICGMSCLAGTRATILRRIATGEGDDVGVGEGEMGR